jgi:ribonuclease HI
VRNASLFEDKAVPAIQCATQGMSILNRFKQTKNDKLSRNIFVEDIDRSGAWAYFDGASHGDPQLSGARGVIYLIDTHIIKFKAGMEIGSYNFAELMAQKLTLMLTAEKGVSNIQTFGDSLVVINWIRGVNAMGKILLKPIYEEIQNFKEIFNCNSFHYVYSERLTRQ